jgi:hypothetical protein
MPQTPHVERHFTGGETVRDVVIGMSDGLTVPFALADTVFTPRAAMHWCPTHTRTRTKSNVRASHHLKYLHMFVS